MHVDIDSIADIAKSYSQKIEKQPDDTEKLIGHLKFANLFLTREQIDALLSRPDGWTQACMFDEFGYPALPIELCMPTLVADMTGKTIGIRESDSITLSNSAVSSISLVLTKHGAKMSGEITWEVFGDETTSLEPLQGKTCRVVWVLSTPDQVDLFKPRTDPSPSQFDHATAN